MIVEPQREELGPMVLVSQKHAGDEVEALELKPEMLRMTPDEWPVPIGNIALTWSSSGIFSLGGTCVDRRRAYWEGAPGHA